MCGFGVRKGSPKVDDLLVKSEYAPPVIKKKKNRLTYSRAGGGAVCLFGL